jgi:hypothetical protein
MELVDERVVEILRQQSTPDRLRRADAWTGEATWVFRKVHAQLGRDVRVADEVFTPSSVLRRAMPMLDGCEWFVAGSIAAMAYGEPRSTQNINIVVRRSDRVRTGLNALLSVSGAAAGDKSSALGAQSQRVRKGICASSMSQAGYGWRSRGRGTRRLTESASHARDESRLAAISCCPSHRPRTWC